MISWLCFNIRRTGLWTVAYDLPIIFTMIHHYECTYIIIYMYTHMCVYIYIYFLHTHTYIYIILIWDISWIYGQWAENSFIFGQVDVVTPFRPGAFHPSSVALLGLGCGWPGHATSKDCSDSLPSSEVKFSRRTGWSCCWYDVSWLSWLSWGEQEN